MRRKNTIDIKTKNKLKKIIGGKKSEDIIENKIKKNEDL